MAEEEGSLDKRKRISKGTYKNNRRKLRGRFVGKSDEEIRQIIQAEDAKRAQEAEETKVDQDPELNKQREDMKQGDYLKDPETEFDFKDVASSQIKNILKYGLPVKSTYAGLSQAGIPALKYLFLNGRF